MGSEKQLLVVTRRRGASVLMMSVEANERAEHDRQLLRLLATGEKEIADGEGHDLDDVLAEADATPENYLS